MNFYSKKSDFVCFHFFLVKNHMHNEYDVHTWTKYTCKPDVVRDIIIYTQKKTQFIMNKIMLHYRLHARGNYGWYLVVIKFI